MKFINEIIAYARALKADKRGATGSRVVTDISISILVVAFIFTLALRTLATSNMTGVDPTVRSFVTLLIPIFGGLAIVMYFVNKQHTGGK